MHRKALSVLRRHLSRDTTVTHLAVLAGIVMVSAALTAGPLGSSLVQPEPSSPAADPSAAAPAISHQIEAEPTQALHQNLSPSTRGDRPVASPTVTWDAAPPPARPEPEAAAPAPPTLPTAAPTAVPTTVPAPLPTAEPAVASTVAPTVAPTEVPRPPAPTVAPPPPTPAPAAKVEALSQLRVGLQAGHWKNAELPAELAVLRGSTGAAGSGWREVDVNLAVAQKTATILRDRGIIVDLIPATVPVAYKADAFVSIHGDANNNPSASGYKLARASWSKIPQKEDALLQAVSAEYGVASGLKYHAGSITSNMLQYYGFNWKSFQHAVAPTTPSVILELGFLTTASDRKLMTEAQDRLAEGIAKGIVRFLTSR